MQTSKPSFRGPGRNRLGKSAATRGVMRLAVVLLLGAWATGAAVAQEAIPLEFRLDAIRYNLSSTNGLPISNVRGTPPGSDGRAPSTGLPATANQFRGWVQFGAVVRPT